MKLREVSVEFKIEFSDALYHHSSIATDIPLINN